MILHTMTVGAAGARAAIDAAEAEARRLGKPLTIAVVDSGGELLALHRMDGAVRVSVDSAIVKARTVIRTGVASAVIQDMLDAGHLSVMLMPGTAAMGGAILFDGVVIGAVAASGDTVETDVRVAEAGARAVLAGD
jgi:uncharacterized protein GlcG (DUF336 family)